MILQRGWYVRSKNVAFLHRIENDITIKTICPPNSVSNLTLNPPSPQPEMGGFIVVRTVLAILLEAEL